MYDPSIKPGKNRVLSFVLAETSVALRLTLVCHYVISALRFGPVVLRLLCACVLAFSSVSYGLVFFSRVRSACCGQLHPYVLTVLH